MLRSKAPSSLRTRFIAAVATVFALVAMGGLTAAPAAADVNVRITVVDASAGGAPVASQTLQFGPVGQSPYWVTTDVSGGFGWGGPGWADGEYRLVWFDTAYVPLEPLMLDASVTQATITLDKYRVMGSIPDAAGSGLTSVQVEQNDGGTWSQVGNATITSGFGDFDLRVPNGPNEYRLRFLPDASTGYLETVSGSFTFTTSTPVLDIGDLALNLAPTISGTVLTAVGGSPIVGATVTAALAGADVAMATTSASGDYRITLPGGDASYVVRAELAGFDSQEWNITTAGPDTVDINATAGYARTGIDFALASTPVEISGRILNYYSLDQNPQIQLYSGGATPTLITQTTMGALGAYSFPAVPGGDYFVKVVPAQVDEYLETLIGAGGYTEWSRDDSVDDAFGASHSFTADPAVPSSWSGHDVILAEAAQISGLLQAPGDDAPIEACVWVTSTADSSITMCAETDENGQWWERLPVGSQYTLHAVPTSNRYLSQWWWNAQDEADSTVIGPVTRGYFGSYTFYIRLAPATLNVTAADSATSTPLSVHVYYRPVGSSSWLALESADTDPASSDFTVSFLTDYASGDSTGLSDGDYRVRFEDATGRWLAATSYSSGIEPTGTAGTGPACFIDVPGIAAGAPRFIDAAFDSAAQTVTCGAQVLDYGTLEGSVISGNDFGPVPVVDHTITVGSDTHGYRSDTTDVDGGFFFSHIPNGIYSIEVTPQQHVPGEHEYRYNADELELGNGNMDLGTLVATRYGNVSGLITNWDPALMSGTATVYRYDPCGCWTPGPLSVDIEDDGSFEVPGIDVDGQYAVRVDFDDDYAPAFLGGGYLEPALPFTGIGERDYSLGLQSVELAEYVTISGVVSFDGTPIDGGGVIALPVDGDGTTGFVGYTSSDGSYTVEVAPNVDYQLIAVTTTGQLKLQSYNGHNYPLNHSGPMDFDAVEVGTTAVTGIDFALVAVDEVVFDLETLEWSSATGSYSENPDVDVHLYRKVSGAWQLIETFTSDEDAYAYTEVLGDGDYRLGFSKDGVALAVHDIEAELYYPYADDVLIETAFSPASCYYDLASVRHGSYLWAEVSLVAAPVGSPCGQPAPVITPPATAPKPAKPGLQPLSGLVPSDADLEEGQPEVDAEEPEEAPETTGGDDSAGGSDVETDIGDSSPTQIPWAVWVAVVVLLLLLLGGGVFLFRRR